MAHTVTQCTNEFGIRVALGADPAAILRLVFRRGLTLVALGAALGLTAALAATRVLRSFLHNVSPTDPLTIAAATMFLAAIAALAVWLPAWRATRVDPIQALRAD